jgi:cyclohexadienyl dehydratase
MPLCRAFLILALLYLLFPSPAFAGPWLDAIKERGSLRVGLTGDYLPFSHFDAQSGAWSGSDVLLAQRLAASLGVKAQFVQTSWPQLNADLQDGRFDIAMGGISVTPERAKIGQFSSSVLSDGKTPLARCENQFRYQTLPVIDQPSVRVIVNPGGTNERFVRSHLHRATITVHKDNRSIFDELIAGRAEVMITDATEARWQAQQHPELCAIHPDAPFDHSDKAYLMQRDKDLQAAVESWLAATKANATLRSPSAK